MDFSERGLIFQVTLGPPRQRKVSFFSAVASWNLLLLDLEEEKVAKKGHKSGDHLKTKGGASQGKRFHLVTLGPPRQGEAKHT